MERGFLGGGNTSSLITFTINGTTYQAEEGMTWGEWVESDYSKANPNYYFDTLWGVQMFYSDGESIGFVTEEVTAESVSTSSVIIANCSYSVS